MNYIEKLENVTVLGAAGKMGSGILLLTALEMLNQKLKPENKDKQFVLYAMDVSNAGLAGLLEYIKEQGIKYAEKNIVGLRKAYASRNDLVDNEEIIRQFASDLTALVRTGTRIEPAFESRIIFEAVSEQPDLKLDLLLTINRNSRQQPWFFSNTSAIPIAWLDERAGLMGRIMGVHFYNPPAVQKLLEVVKTETTNPELSYFVTEYLKNLGKIFVPSYDVAGFIGNGYFMRDIMFAETLVNQLQKDFTFSQSLYMVNKISQDFLIRPMGIFQLVDYVGIDVVQFIMSVMNSYSENEKIHSPLIDKFMELNIRGGQNPDGSQKDGFFQYKNGKMISLYDTGKRRYLQPEEYAGIGDTHLGPLPHSWQPWKKLVREKDKEGVLNVYFNELKSSPHPGATMAVEYLKKFREIGTGLVKNKVAFKFEDVNSVLTKGFHHVYGPVNSYF